MAPQRKDRLNQRRTEALARRENELSRWKNGHFVVNYGNFERMEAIVARKIETAEAEIRNLKEKIR